MMINDFEVRHPRCVEPELQNVKITVKTQLYLLAMSGWRHIAVYNYMFRPLSAIIRLYYFLL